MSPLAVAMGRLLTLTPVPVCLSASGASGASATGNSTLPGRTGSSPAASPFMPLQASAPPADDDDEDDDYDYDGTRDAPVSARTQPAPCVPTADLLVGLLGHIAASSARMEWGIHVAAVLGLPKSPAFDGMPCATHDVCQEAAMLLATLARYPSLDRSMRQAAVDLAFGTGCHLALVPFGESTPYPIALGTTHVGHEGRDVLLYLAQTAEGRVISPPLLSAAQQDSIMPAETLRPFVIEALNTAAAARYATLAAHVPTPAPTPVALPAPVTGVAGAALSASSAASLRGELLSLLASELAAQRMSMAAMVEGAVEQARQQAASASTATLEAERAQHAQEVALLRREVATLRSRVALLEATTPTLTVSQLEAMAPADRGAALVGLLARGLTQPEAKVLSVCATICSKLKDDTPDARALAVHMSNAGAVPVLIDLAHRFAASTEVTVCKTLCSTFTLVRFRAGASTSVAISGGLVPIVLGWMHRFRGAIADSASASLWNVLQTPVPAEKNAVQSQIVASDCLQVITEALHAGSASGTEQSLRLLLAGVRASFDPDFDPYVGGSGVCAAVVEVLQRRPDSAIVATAAAQAIRELASGVICSSLLRDAGVIDALAAAAAKHAAGSAAAKEIAAAQAALDRKVASRL